jgi:hypothetical protein
LQAPTDVVVDPHLSVGLEGTAMPEKRSRHVVGLIVALVGTLVVFAGLVEGTRTLSGLGYEPSPVSATIGANLTLSVFPDSYACHGSNGGPGGGPHPEWVTYCPSTSIKVPAYSTVTVTIKQYDSSTTLHNPFFSQVSGTVGDVISVNGQSVQRISPDALGHTFTIQTPPDPGETQLFVNVPLPGVSKSAPSTETIAGHQYPKPNVIVFKFRTGAPGQYIWHCYIPCGTGLAGDGIGGQKGFGGPMATTAYMAGTLTVT